MLPDTLGQAIKDRRNELNITAEELAGIVGVDRTFISKIERHGLLPSQLVLERIEKALRTKDLFDLYIKEKNPLLEKRSHHFFPMLPSMVRKEFRTPESERLVRFIYRNTEATTTILTRSSYELLLTHIAPEKVSDDKLLREVFDIVKELKKERDVYWQKFIQQSKRIESLITDHKPASK